MKEYTLHRRLKMPNGMQMKGSAAADDEAMKTNAGIIKNHFQIDEDFG